MEKSRSQLQGLTILTALFLLLSVPTSLPQIVSESVSLIIFLLSIFSTIKALKARLYDRMVFFGSIALVYNPILLIFAGYESKYIVDIGIALSLFAIAMNEKDE